MKRQSHIKLGLFSYSYHLAFGAHEVFTPSTKMNLHQFIDEAKEMGLDGIQIDAMHLQSDDDEYIASLRSYSEAWRTLFGVRHHRNREGTLTSSP